jgi:hypothetical protein
METLQDTKFVDVNQFSGSKNEASNRRYNNFDPMFNIQNHSSIIDVGNASRTPRQRYIDGMDETNETQQRTLFGITIVEGIFLISIGIASLWPNVGGIIDGVAIVFAYVITIVPVWLIRMPAIFIEPSNIGLGRVLKLLRFATLTRSLILFLYWIFILFYALIYKIPAVVQEPSSNVIFITAFIIILVIICLDMYVVLSVITRTSKYHKQTIDAIKEYGGMPYRSRYGSVIPPGSFQ